MVQNPNAETAAVTVGFIDDSGARLKDVSNPSLAGGENWVIDVSSVAGLGAGRYSVVIESDRPVKALTHLMSSGPTTGDSYGATADTESAPTLYAAAVLRNLSGFSTSVTVQNTGTADVNVAVVYRGADGVQVATDSSSALKPGAAVTFDQGGDSRFGDNFAGSAAISANGPIAAVVQVYNSGGTGMLATCNATGAASRMLLPVTLKLPTAAGLHDHLRAEHAVERGRQRHAHLREWARPLH